MSCPSSTPLPSSLNLLPEFLLNRRQCMNDEPSTNKFDRNELHTPTVRKPSNRKPSRRLVFRLATNTLSDREPSTKHLLFRQVLFGVGMNLDIHASSPLSYPISYDESPLSLILKPAPVERQGAMRVLRGVLTRPRRMGGSTCAKGERFRNMRGHCRCDR